MGREKPEKEEREEEEGSGRKLGAGLKHHLGVIDLGTVLGANNHGSKLGANYHDAKLRVKIYGTKLSAKIYGAKAPAKSLPRLHRAQDLDAKIHGAETCKLDATNDGAELRV